MTDLFDEYLHHLALGRHRQLARAARRSAIGTGASCGGELVEDENAAESRHEQRGHIRLIRWRGRLVAESEEEGSLGGRRDVGQQLHAVRHERTLRVPLANRADQILQGRRRQDPGGGTVGGVCIRRGRILHRSHTLLHVRA